MDTRVNLYILRDRVPFTREPRPSERVGAIH